MYQNEIMIEETRRALSQIVNTIDQLMSELDAAEFRQNKELMQRALQNAGRFLVKTRGAK